jgi:hypothetical protein
VRTGFGRDGGVRMRFDAARPALMRPSSVPGVQAPREPRGAVERRTVSPPVSPPARRGFGRATLVPDVETMTVVPGGLDQHTAQMRVTGFGDRADAALAPARTLRGHEARVAHDFAGVLETTEPCARRDR